jgi:hypothetical protein
MVCDYRDETRRAPAQRQGLLPVPNDVPLHGPVGRRRPVAPTLVVRVEKMRLGGQLHAVDLVQQVGDALVVLAFVGEEPLSAGATVERLIALPPTGSSWADPRDR